jgi:hypothetical protein
MICGQKLPDCVQPIPNTRQEETPAETPKKAVKRKARKGEE